MPPNAATSYPREKMRILLLEGIHPVAVEAWERAGYRPEHRASAMSEDELLEIAPSLHVIGLRSKTHLTPAVLARAKNLLAIGCYCIGTDQVALEEAALEGAPVFNAPFSNTRSVAELTIAEVVMLARRATHRSQQLHSGTWEKSAAGSFEVRGRTIGIVGYGHIGPQVGLLAEAFGMQVLYFDIAKKLPLGSARPVASLQELLRLADFVTLHVPDTPTTRGMIGAEELRAMREGAYLLNLSRGSVVDLDALRDALRSGRIAGAAIDVYPEEPRERQARFESPLRGLDNVILTPHVGGSTIEAQRAIGEDVTDTLLRFVETGCTGGAVNFPVVEPPDVPEAHRVLNVHRNEPGVLRDINRLVADTGANVLAQHLETNRSIGYLVMDVEPSLSRAIKREIDGVPANIRTRLLF